MIDEQTTHQTKPYETFAWIFTGTVSLKFKFVLGFGIAITNSRGFNRWKVCFISFFPRQQPNSDKEMINVGCG